MLEPRRWPPEALVPIGAGLLWLKCAASLGTVGLLLSLIPGCLLLSGGVAALLYPGDLRIAQFTALGAVLGVPALFVAGTWDGIALLFLSAASFAAAGAISVRQEPPVEAVPAPVLTLGLATQVAIDEAILATMSLRLPFVLSDEQARVRSEVRQARELFAERGWLRSPGQYHEPPPVLTDPVIRPARSCRLDYEHIEFDSGYEPRAREPGRDRWLSKVANRTAHAWVLRHHSEPRPWLVCIHGYEMGFAALDLLAFRAARLHCEHGVNLALPVLPLHGPRKIGRRSGQGFLSGDFVDTIHAEAQAMWDMRRLLSWIRAQGEVPVGVYGLSLGGYNAALLASIEELACVIAGIPAVDFARLTWRHSAPLQVRYAEHIGLVRDEVNEVLRVISPLALEPRVPKGRRTIFAGVADRLVPPEQARDLWLHWDRPRIVWYQGGHVTFRSHPAVGRSLMDALREAELLR